MRLRRKNYLATSFIILTLSIKPVLGLQSSSQTISSYGRIKVGEMEIYAKVDFETGDLSQVTELGGIADNPPLAKCEIESNIVREGNYSMVCYQTDPSKAQRSKAVFSELGNLHLNECYYGFSIFLSPTLRAPGWLQIFEECQYVSEVANWPHIAQLQTCELADGKPHLNILKGEIAPTDALWTDPVPIPLGQWIDFVIYINISINGTVILWQNGVLKAEVHYDTTAMGQPASAYPEIGLYQDAGNPSGNWVIFDRFVAANTFEQANS